MADTQELIEALRRNTRAQQAQAEANKAAKRRDWGRINFIGFSPV